MTRIRIMGMALVCAFALLAVAAAGASAAPEFSSAGAEITTVSGTGVLVGAGTTITCTSDGGKGEVTSKTQINSTVTFKGCSGEVFGGKCPSEITSVLTGTLGEVAKGEAESEVGLLFKPKSGTTFAEFKCGDHHGQSHRDDRWRSQTHQNTRHERHRHVRIGERQTEDQKNNRRRQRRKTETHGPRLGIDPHLGRGKHVLQRTRSHLSSRAGDLSLCGVLAAPHRLSSMTRPGRATPAPAAPRHPRDLPLGDLREERQRDRTRRHVLADRELALAVAEALAVEAHQVNRRQVGLARDPPLARARGPSRRDRPRAAAGRRTRTSRAGLRRGPGTAAASPSIPASASAGYRLRRPRARAPPASPRAAPSWASPIAHAMSDRR